MARGSDGKITLNFEADIRQLQAKLDVLNNEVHSLGDNAKKDTEKAGSGFKSMAGKIATAAGAIVALKKSYDLLAQNLSQGMELQTNMAEVYTLIDITEQQFKDLTNSVIELSQEVPESAHGLSSALYEVVSAGVDVGNSMQFLETSAMAGVAGVTQTKIAVDALTTVMNAYQLSTDQAREISDKLFTTVRLGKIRFDNIASTLGMVVPVASAYGVAFDEIAAAYATLTKNGLKAERTSTSLAVAITEMVTPSSKAAKAIRELGYDSGETALKEKGLQQITKELYLSGKNIAEIFGQEAARAVLLLGKNYDSAAKDLQEMGNSAGATEKAYNKMGDTLKVKTDVLKNNLQALGVVLNDTIVPKLSEAAEYATEFIRQLTESDIDTSIRKLKEYGIEAGKLAQINAYNEMLKSQRELLKINKELEKTENKHPLIEGFRELTDEDRMRKIKNTQDEIAQYYTYLLKEQFEFEANKEDMSIMERSSAHKSMNYLQDQIDLKEGNLEAMMKILDLEGRATNENERQALAQKILNKLKEDEKKIVEDTPDPKPIVSDPEKESDALKNRINWLQKWREEYAAAADVDYVDSLIEEFKKLEEWEKKNEAVIDGITGLTKQFADNMGQALLYGRKLGPAFVDSLKAIAAQVVSMTMVWGVLKMLQGGGVISGIGSLGSFLGDKLMGFAEGGSFTVPGGSGGTDSQVVAFKATPGEHVSVSTPEQAGNSDVAQRLDTIIGLLKKGGNFKVKGNDLALMMDEINRRST